MPKSYYVLNAGGDKVARVTGLGKSAKAAERMALGLVRKLAAASKPKKRNPPRKRRPVARKRRTLRSARRTRRK